MIRLMLVALLWGCGPRLSKDCPFPPRTLETVMLHVGESALVDVYVHKSGAGKVDLTAQGSPIDASFADGSSTVGDDHPGGPVQVKVTCTIEGMSNIFLTYRGEDDCQTILPVLCSSPTNTTTITSTSRPPSTIPPGSTDCTVDADGCLVDDGSGCGIELDEALTGDSATLTVTGSVQAGPALSLISSMLFAYIDTYYGGVYGPGCKVDPDEATIVDEGFIFVNSADLPPEPSGTRDVVITCAVDNGLGTVQMDTQLADTQVISIDGDGLFPSSETTAYVGVRGGRVCGIELQQP